MGRWTLIKMEEIMEKSQPLCMNYCYERKKNEVQRTNVSLGLKEKSTGS